MNINNNGCSIKAELTDVPVFLIYCQCNFRGFNIVIKRIFQVVSVEDPPVREAGQTVADVDELVGKLKDKGFSS